MNSILSDLLESIDMSKEDADSLILHLFTCKDVNRVPWETFSFLKMVYQDILDMDKENAEIMAIITGQGLSVINQLVINAYDKELTEDDFLAANSKRETTFEEIKDNLIKDYKLHWITNNKKESFLKAIGDITDNQEVLTSAANFIHLHCVEVLTDEKEVHRNLALANLLRLSSLNNIYKELKVILKKELDIDEEALVSFITEHINVIFGG